MLFDIVSIPFSMPASRPAHTYLLPQAALTSALPVTSAHLDIQRCQASPISINGMHRFLTRGTMPVVDSVRIIAHST